MHPPRPETAANAAPIPPLREIQPEPGTTHIKGIDFALLPQSAEALEQQAGRLHEFAAAKSAELGVDADGDDTSSLLEAMHSRTAVFMDAADHEGWHTRAEIKAAHVGIPTQADEKIDDIEQRVHGYYQDAARNVLRGLTDPSLSDEDLRWRTELLAETVPYAYIASTSDQVIDTSPDAIIHYHADLLDPEKVARLSEAQAESIYRERAYEGGIAVFLNTEPGFFAALEASGVDAATLSPDQLKTYYDAAQAGIPCKGVPYETLTDLVEAFENGEREAVYSGALLEAFVTSARVENVGYVATGFTDDAPAWLKTPAILNQSIKHIRFSWRDIGRAIDEGAPGFLERLRAARAEQKTNPRDRYRVDI